MRVVIVLSVVVALLAVGLANVVLLGYGAGGHDPVGRLSPLIRVPAPGKVQPAAPALTREGPDD